MTDDPNLIRIGNANAREDVLRDGRLHFVSGRGLARATKLLIEALPATSPGPFLVSRDRTAAIAIAARRLWPEVSVTEHHHDAFVAGLAHRNLASNAARVESVLGPTLPVGPFALIAMSFEAGADSLVARELIEEAHDALLPGGQLLAGTDGKHTWLEEAVEHVFRNARCIMPSDGPGAVMRAERKSTIARKKDRRHALRVTHAGRTLSLATCPGVFSHGRLDRGTKALLEVASERTDGPILDLGCGPGTLGIALAQDDGAGLVLVDSDTRAIACATENLSTHGLSGAQALLRGDLEDLPALPYRLATANPPYYGDGRIANSFTARAAGLLHTEGRLMLVARDAARHAEIVSAHFLEVEAKLVGDYTVFTARKARAPKAE